MPVGHMKYGGSKMELIELCPGATAAQAELPEVAPGPAAERGTRLHSLTELILKEKRVPRGKTKQEIEEIQVAQAAAAAVVKLFSELGIDHTAIQLEQSITLEHIHPEAGGTFDQGGVRPFAHAVIVDTKFGGRFVGAEDNLQLAFYAVGFMRTLDSFTAATISQIHMAIVQPTQEPPYTPAVRVWTVTPAELAVYERRISAAISMAEANPDRRIAGDHCEGKYCGARTICPAYRAWLDEKAGGLLTAALAGSKDKPHLTGQALANLLDAESQLNGLLKQAKADALTLLLQNPDSVPGYQVDAGLGNRAIKDEKALEKALKDAGFKPDEFKPRVWVGVPALDSLIAAKKAAIDLSQYVERPQTGPKLSKSKEAKQDLAEMFAAAAQ